jgi:hypothetical protein
VSPGPPVSKDAEAQTIPQRTHRISRIDYRQVRTTLGKLRTRRGKPDGHRMERNLIRLLLAKQLLALYCQHVPCRRHFLKFLFVMRIHQYVGKFSAFFGVPVVLQCSLHEGDVLTVQIAARPNTNVRAHANPRLRKSEPLPAL